MPTSSTYISGDCFSSSQYSNEMRKEVKNGKDHGAFFLLRRKCWEYPKNVILGHPNIKSLWNQFDLISELIKGKIDIFLINKTTLDVSFPGNQFVMSGYKFIEKRKNKSGGGISFYVNDQLPRQTITIENPRDIEILAIEITISKNKILLQGYINHLTLVKPTLLLASKPL